MKLICLTLLCSAQAVLLAAGPAMKCDALAAKSFGDDVKIASATLVPAKGNMPEHCDVRGAIWPEARFAIKLPTEWNERFQMDGNGGTAGTISLGPVDAAVRKGFAASSTDTGHDAAKEPLATFAYVTPENPTAAASSSISPTCRFMKPTSCRSASSKPTTARHRNSPIGWDARPAAARVFRKPSVTPKISTAS